MHEHLKMFVLHVLFDNAAYIVSVLFVIGK